MKPMSDKTLPILDAAMTMFSRYGYTKTTMGDIATAAGVSRQTVYNAFPGKEEILRATMRKYGTESVQAVRAEWDKTPGIAGKIDVFHTHVPLKWYESMTASPDWADLMDGLHNAASEEVKAMDDSMKAALTEVFATALGDTHPGGRNAADLVDFFYNASINAKHGAQDLAHLRKRLDTVKAATLALMD